ncbi:biotin/lipoyl-containing protein [Telmatospirillum siberiense]|uniref:Acetyl-CoA carboxylase biotin carboxyl carrier protein subunit n=1 Tax=Telmatospirillum siberiense TaxID=382514 RepID=A0A2N3PM39_9PROT|nr:acetyl-CoA carboxylase biotin carboxyl carrier protein subunit [Telmatospirillum siberiense]PKU21461.1 acetyl-CoA carboxylase biotin carboxyl carrier protein subunit [Telmatospirillum siberiense]
MFKKFRITVEGRPYNVVVEELSSDATEPAPALPAASPAPALSAAPAPVAAIGAPPAPAATVASAPAQAGDEVAPLAGVIVSIEVGLGAQVRVGDRIAVIEAMKMKTDVFAKHGGTVTRIAVSAHEGVETGQVLLTVG